MANHIQILECSLNKVCHFIVIDVARNINYVQIAEKKLEGLSEVIGTNVVEKYSNTVCRQITQDATGAYTGYVAVHVLLDDLQKGLQEELDVRKVDYDADKLKKQCDAEMAKK